MLEFIDKLKKHRILRYGFSLICLSLFVLWMFDLTGFVDIFGSSTGGLMLAALPPLVSLDYDSDCNIAGIKRAFVIPVEDIATFAVPVANPTTQEARISIVGSHTLDSSKYWVKMYSTQGKGTLNFSSEGGRDFEKVKIGGSLFYPSTAKAAMAAAVGYLNRDVIILLEPYSDDGCFWQVGTEKIPARIKPSGDWGTELNGEKGITFEIDHMACLPPYAYEGVIPISVSEVIS